MPGHEDKMPFGNRPNGIYVPRFRNTNEKTKQKNFVRGYGYQGGAAEKDGPRRVHERIRRGLQEHAENAGAVADDTGGFGECLPYHSNCVELNKEKPDAWGIPTLTINCKWEENEKTMSRTLRCRRRKFWRLPARRDRRLFGHDATWTRNS